MEIRKIRRHFNIPTMELADRRPEIIPVAPAAEPAPVVAAPAPVKDAKPVEPVAPVQAEKPVEEKTREKEPEPSEDDDEDDRGAEGTEGPLKPWQFLALVFKYLVGSTASFETLEKYRDYLKERYGLDVEWDEANLTFGVYDEVFSVTKNKKSVACNKSALKSCYDEIIDNGPKVPAGLDMNMKNWEK